MTFRVENKRPVRFFVLRISLAIKEIVIGLSLT